MQSRAQIKKKNHGALAGTIAWAWGGEGRPRRPRKPDEPLLGSHCWQVGDPLLGDPPHEAAGWYSIFDVDHTTHAAMANLGARACLTAGVAWLPGLMT